MLDRLDERLMVVKERVRAKRKLESMLGQAEKVVREETSNCSRQQDKLAAEKKDVDKLEGLSLAGLFYSVLGSKDERLEKERQEWLAAKLKHEEATLALEEAQRETRGIRDELAPLADADAEYDRLIDEKEALLAQTDDDKARRLLELSEKLADLKSEKKELQEAIRAGEAALNSLRQVSSELESAAGWGGWDMMGGGMFATMAKHSKIDSAKQHAHFAQAYLRRFQQELADADQRLHVTLEIGGFSKFADFFFDGLIADWVVQSKIQKASAACSTTMFEVRSALDQCRRRLADSEQGVEKCDAARRGFIEQA